MSVDVIREIRRSSFLPWTPNVWRFHAHSFHWPTNRGPSSHPLEESTSFRSGVCLGHQPRRENSVLSGRSISARECSRRLIYQPARSPLIAHHAKQRESEYLSHDLDDQKAENHQSRHSRKDDACDKPAQLPSPISAMSRPDDGPPDGTPCARSAFSAPSSCVQSICPVPRRSRCLRRLEGRARCIIVSMLTRRRRRRKYCLGHY